MRGRCAVALGQMSAASDGAHDQARVRTASSNPIQSAAPIMAPIFATAAGKWAWLYGGKYIAAAGMYGAYLAAGFCWLLLVRFACGCRGAVLVPGVSKTAGAPICHWQSLAAPRWQCGGACMKQHKRTIGVVNCAHLPLSPDRPIARSSWGHVRCRARATNQWACS